MTLTETVERKIKEDILSGHYKCGDKLPSIRELSLMLNVSDITIKRAIDGLSRQNYLIRKQGSGVFVAGNADMRQPTIAAFLAEKLSVGSETKRLYYTWLVEAILKANIRKEHNANILITSNCQTLSVDLLKNTNADAFVFAGFKLDSTLVDYLHKKELPYIRYGRVNARCNVIDFDHAAFLHNSLNYLQDKGHKHIGLLIKKTTTEDVSKGIIGEYHRHMFENGCGLCEETVYVVDEDMGNSEDILDKICTAGSMTALICWCMPDSFLEGLTSRGTVIPDNLSVVAYGYSEIYPNRNNVTGYSVSMKQMAEKIMEAISLQLQGKIKAPVDIKVGAEWTEGVTAGKARSLVPV